MNAEEEPKFKPCRFCGERDYDSEEPGLWYGVRCVLEYHEEHYIHCDSCGADGPKADTDEEALKLWNESQHHGLSR